MTRGQARVVAAIAFAVAVTSWPMPVLPRGTMIGAGHLEAVDHVWALWLALRDGPVVIDTRLVDFPSGYRWVLADPINLPFFAVGHLLGGPPAGLSCVHAANLVVAGLSAVALGHVFLPPAARAPSVTALVAVTLPPLAAGLSTGMTEAQTFGWSALSVAATAWCLSPDEPPASPVRRVLLAGVAAGVTAWAGAYALLYAALASVPILAWSALRAARRRTGLAGLAARAAGIGLVASIVAAPVLWAMLTQRSELLPGAQSLTPSVFADPERPDNRALGADLARILLPLRGAVTDDWHTVYLGVVSILLSLVGSVRRKAPWPLALAAAWMLVLSLGVYLQAGGRILRWVDGRILVMPAGMLSLWLDDLGRAPRWYRAAAVAGILLAPLAGAGARRVADRVGPGLRDPALALVGALVVADAVRLAPLPWPRGTFRAAPPDGYAAMDDGSPFVEVPLVRFSSRVGASAQAGTALPDPLRHPALLWQTFHGRAIGGNPHQAGVAPRSTQVTAAVMTLNAAALARDAAAAGDAAGALRDVGFGWIVHHPTAGLAPVTLGLRAMLGTPDVDTPEVQGWRLRPQASVPSGPPTRPARP